MQTQTTDTQAVETQEGEAQAPETPAAETQATLESRVAILEQQNRVLDERLRNLEIMLGAVAVETGTASSVTNVSTTAAAAGQPADSGNQLISNVPAQPAATAPQGPQPFTAYRANVRWGPNTNYPIAMELSQNEPLDIIGYNNDSGKIWFRLASGPWIADFLVRNAPGAIPYISAPSQEEIDSLQRSNEATDAKSDPPALPSPGQSEIDGSDSSSVPIEPASRLPGATTASATSFATSTVASSTGVSVSATTLSGPENEEGVIATAAVTTEFSNLGQNVTNDVPEPSVENVTDEPADNSDDAVTLEPTPVALNTLPLIRRPAQAVLNCNGGCTDYPAWCDPPIKGHLTFDGDEPVYYVPSHPGYSEIPIDIDYGERWFCTVEEAEAAGWRAP